ncbi:MULTISPECIES: hypothetical protein [unclassified Spiroplasma]|uniref:hypothetical protein n=3 Tax=Spiroplasma TaxID=2132 RepID=UPI0030D07671
MNRCTWTETITFEKFIHEPHYDEIKNEQRQRQCENMTEEQFDEYCRAYCKEHRIKVDEINKSRHKNCINKEKLVSFLSEFYNNFNQVEDKWFQSKADTYANILEYLESNEFYNDNKN